MSASECPASNCSMRFWTLAAMTSFAVLGCCWSLLGMVAVVFMVVSPLGVAVAFHAMRGMYLHAERLLAKAGRQGAREGDLPSVERKQSGSGKDEAQRRSAQAQRGPGGRSLPVGGVERGRLRETLAPRQGSALSEAWFPYGVRDERTGLIGWALRAGKARCGGKRRTRSGRSAGGDPSRRSVS